MVRQSHHARKPETLKPRDLGDRRAVAQRAHLAERREREGLPVLAPQGGHQVPGQARRLPRGVLGRRRAGLAALPVDDEGAVPQGPHARPVRHGQVAVDHDPVALLLDGEHRHQRVRRRRHRAHHRPGRDALPALEQRGITGGAGQACPQADLDAPLPEEALGELGERRRQLR